MSDIDRVTITSIGRVNESITLFFIHTQTNTTQFRSFSGYLLTTNIEKCKFPLRCVSMFWYVNFLIALSWSRFNKYCYVKATTANRHERCFVHSASYSCSPFVGANETLKRHQVIEWEKLKAQKNVQIAKATITLTISSIQCDSKISNHV